MNRRTLLSAAAGFALSDIAAEAASFPIIDTHIHLFDPTRPGGVPWPPKDSPIYKPALPDRYRRLVEPLGIKGAIEVECSPLLEDNQWVLDVAAKDKFILGMIGDLEPEKPDFRKQLDRFQKNPLYLGIRCGNLWGRDFSAQVGQPEFIAGIKALAAADLTLDIANPNTVLLNDLVRLTDKVPEARVVLDHLPQFQPPTEPAARRAYDTALHALGERKQIFLKVSEVLRRVDGKVPTDPAFYRPRLDELWDVFGEDRVVYGSDWPNSDLWEPYPQVLSVVRDYFTRKGPAAAEKYFWKNSVKAYRWKKREKGQPG